MAKTSPAQFIREVRQETAKVTWPSRKETAVTTVMVFIMVVVMSAMGTLLALNTLFPNLLAGRR